MFHRKKNHRTVCVFNTLSNMIGILLLFLSCESPKKEKLLHNYTNATIQMFASGVISTRNNHESLSYISKHGNEIIFTRSSNDFKNSGLFYSKYDNSLWSEPEKIYLTASNYEAGITFSPNGNKAFFTNRTTAPNTSNEWNIWEIEVNSLNNFDSSSAKPVNFPVNTNNNECCITMNSNGTTLFSSNRYGSWDIYQVNYINNEFHNIKKLGPEINSDKTDEWPSYLNNEEDILFFSSIRKSGFGGDDIYCSFKEGEKWKTAKILNQKINTNSYEDGAFITTNHNFLFFSSWKNNNNDSLVSNIYIYNLEKDNIHNLIKTEE